MKWSVDDRIRIVKEFKRTLRVPKIKGESLIKKHNQENKIGHIDLPTFKMVITSNRYGYKTKDGVYVVPIGCLKD